MAERIIDRFEAVKINDQDREPLFAAPQSRQRFGELLHEQRAISEIGQFVTAGHAGNLRLDPLLRGDVLMHPDPAAVVPRLMCDRNHAAVPQFIDGAERRRT
jgi:hypothetical protein